jgi:hypothetical protein
MALSLAALESAWTSTTTPKTVVVTGALTGDYLFVIAGSGATGGSDITAATTTTTVGTTGSWTEPVENLNVPQSESWVSSAVAQVTADGDVTVQVAVTMSVARGWGFAVIRARGSTGLGASGFVDVSATQVVNLTVSTGSAVFFASFDFSAGTVGTGWTPTSDVTLIERTQDGSNQTIHAAYWENQAAGTRDYGSTGAGGTGRKTVGLEILAAAGGPPPSLMFLRPVQSPATLSR